MKSDKKPDLKYLLNRRGNGNWRTDGFLERKLEKKVQYKYSSGVFYPVLSPHHPTQRLSAIYKADVYSSAAADDGYFHKPDLETTDHHILS